MAQGLQAHLSGAEFNVLPSLGCSDNSAVFSAVHLGALFIWTQQIPTAIPFPMGQSSHEDKCYIVVFAIGNFALFFIWDYFSDRGRGLAGNTLVFKFFLCSEALDKLCDAKHELRDLPNIFPLFLLMLYTSLMPCTGDCL